MSDRTPSPTTIACRVALARAAIENLHPLELAAELAGPTRVVLIDVRGAEELVAGRIGGALNVARGTAEVALPLTAHRAERIVVYCDTGERSALLADVLYELGYQNVAHLAGGLDAWTNAGLPIVTAAAGTGAVPTRGSHAGD